MNAYPHHPRRNAQCLDGAWDFAWMGDVDPGALRPAAIAFDGKAAVPGVFDTGVERFGARGVGVYQRRVHVAAPPGTPLRLTIGALGLRGRAWWDDAPLGEVEMPYSRETFSLAADGAPWHTLTLAVDNRFDPERSPLFPPGSDFYAHGGLYRGVTLEVLPALRVERAIVTTLALAPARVRVTVRLAGNVPDRLTFALALDEAEPQKRAFRPQCDGSYAFELDLPGVTPWSPEHPELHTLTVSCGDDTVVERFGVRTVETRDGAILLNGEPLRLLGVNRHESHPQFGPVQPLTLILEDLQAIKALGCNFVRAVHYPQAPELLDLCDEMGLLLWQESLSWGLTEPQLLAAAAQRQVTEQTRRMVREGLNHPSLVIWGFLNECASDSDRAEPFYAQLAALVRAEDPTRLVAYASNRGDRDRCFRHVDLVCLNLYPGWIWPIDWQAPSAAQIAPFVARMADLSQRADLRGKPLLVTEIGACALYGCHDRAAAQWSEEYQAAYVAESCRAVLADPRWSGVVLWQFCDTRSYVGSGEVRCKPRGFNNAGLVDEYRRPKLAFETARAAFAAASKTPAR